MTPRKKTEPDYTLTAFKLPNSLLDKVKAYAYWIPGASQKDCVVKALEDFFDKYEKKNGVLDTSFLKKSGKGKA